MEKNAESNRLEDKLTLLGGKTEYRQDLLPRYLRPLI